MEFLTKDMVFYIGLRLELRDLTSLSRACKRLNGFLCGNGEFWRVKYCKEFGFDGIDEVVGGKVGRIDRRGSKGKGRSDRCMDYKILFRETLKNVRFVKTIYDEFSNSYVDSKLVMNLYNKVFKYFSGKGLLHFRALLDVIILLSKGRDEDSRCCTFYIFSFLMRKGVERITKEKFIELTKCV